MSLVALSKLPQTKFLDMNGNIDRAWLLFMQKLALNVNRPENAWPIGSIFITTSAAAPSALLGFGTWSAFGSGRVMVGMDSGDTDFDVSEETGGAKTATPAGTVSQPTFAGNALAGHSHGPGTLAVPTHANHTHDFTQSSNAATPDLVQEDTTGAGVAANGTTGNESVALSHTISGSTESVSAGTPAGTVSQPTFTGAAMSIQQKYIVVKMWKRTA